MGDTWTVVQFVDDSSVEVVPSTWIHGNYCHWSSFPPDKLISAIWKSEPFYKRLLSYIFSHSYYL